MRTRMIFLVVEGLAESQAADIFDTIDDMVEEGLNPITIYIIAHGGDQQCEAWWPVIFGKSVPQQNGCIQ